MSTSATPATAALASVQAAAAQTPKTKAKTVLTKGQVQSIKRRAALQTKIKAMKARVEAYDAEFQDILNESGADIGVTEDGIKVVERMYSNNTRYDREVLVSRFPAAAAASFRSTPYSFIKTL